MAIQQNRELCPSSKMKVSVKVKLEPKLEENLTFREDRIMYEIASETLKATELGIPLRTGKMRTSSMNSGVKGSNKKYYIGSYTSYAKYVWKMDENVNWTTPGTNNRWFERTWKNAGERITKYVIERNKL